MALILDISMTQQNNCSTFVITDTTGEYSASTNTTGWSMAHHSSTPNLVIDTGQVQTATLAIISPGAAATKVFDLMDQTVWTALTGYLTAPFNTSTSPSNLAYTVEAEDLGFSVTDGIWQIEYSVADSYGNAYSLVRSFGVTCAINCCVNKLIARIPDHYNCDTCNNEFVQNVVVIKGLLKALELAANDALLTDFETLLESLRDLCELFGEECTC